MSPMAFRNLTAKIVKEAVDSDGVSSVRAGVPLKKDNDDYNLGVVLDFKNEDCSRAFTSGEHRLVLLETLLRPHIKGEKPIFEFSFIGTAGDIPGQRVSLVSKVVSISKSAGVSVVTAGIISGILSRL